MKIKEKHRLNCHCGAVELELTLPNGLENPRRCDCSMCRRRGAIVASVVLDNLKVIKGEDKLSLYQFNTNTAKHFFCSVCGIYTHHQRRSNPSQYGFNRVRYAVTFRGYTESRKRERIPFPLGI
jgi:hypothetical protein